MKISVLGAGGWGTALAVLLSKNGHKVTMWEYNPEYAEILREYRENFYFLPKVKIPKNIVITNDIYVAVSKSEILLVTTPTQFIRSSFESLREHKFANQIVLGASKGIEENTHLLVSEIFSDIFPKLKKSNIAVISGPSHAEEVSRKVPTAVVTASGKKEINHIVQKAFSNKYFRVYTSQDLIGVEIGGALKNVIAIASGIADGAGFGDNTKAALMTRGISELMRLGIKLGAQSETFFGLSGIGDLIVTCSSKHSRNRFVGEKIGEGKKLKSILKEMKMVAEGVATTRSAYELSKINKVELPIVNEVYGILFRGKNPHRATNVLMNRELKKEY
jgi:glycerol-3-phosphate dehydrogenase (NAD(P)+)